MLYGILLQYLGNIVVSACEYATVYLYLLENYTNQGSQFTVVRFEALLKKYGVTHSQSRKGNPYDNAVMEFYYRILKRELI